MKIVITGGTGFLGRRLAKGLLSDGTLNGETIGEIVLFDQVVGDTGIDDQRVKVVAGDLGEQADVTAAIGDAGAVFHLGAVVSGQAEEDLDLGLRVNLDGTRHVLEACRAGNRSPLFVFASSIAAYGGDLPKTITDSTLLTPATSYGAQKVACEMLVMDFTRRGLIDGRAVRLPTVSVRPGKPNKAASGFASGIAREPLSGVDFVCPVSPQSKMVILSPRRAEAAFRWVAGLPSDVLGHDRTILLPGISVSMKEMVAAVGRGGGDAAASRISFDVDPKIQGIVDGWPQAIDARRAKSLGFEGDLNIDEVIAAFVADDLPNQ